MKNGLNNMFNFKHYVPILKWKRAEQTALENLPKEDKSHITPLIQFVMPKAKAPKEGQPQKDDDQKFIEVIATFEARAPKIYEEIAKFWGKSTVFVDFSLLYTLALKVMALEQTMAGVYTNEGSAVPVVNLSDDPKLKKTAYMLAKKYSSGVCLRIVPADLIDISGTNEQIDIFLKLSGMDEKSVDLLIDTKEIQGDVERLRRFTLASQKIKNLTKWRTFILASGAFPADLSECKVDEENVIPRYDWANWVELIRDKNTIRKPAFGDYTIQHPIYNESSQFFHPTTSIKYALETDWLVLKGKKQKFDMYLANAQLLAQDKRFYGEDFSSGDKYIAEKGNHYTAYAKNPDIKGTGSTETWIMAGINHHLVLASHQVANLS
jgi:hypothetical protein